MPPEPSAKSIRSLPIFRRLIGLLRPKWPTIALALVFLFISMPAEIFPAMVWMYVADFLVMQKPTGSSLFLNRLFSFNGHIPSDHHMALLASSLVWLAGVYLIGTVMGTIETNLMNRVAQWFILDFRNKVYFKLQSQSLGYLQQQRTGDLMSRAMGDVDELQSFIVNSIDTIIGDGVTWLFTVVLVFILDWRVSLISLSPLLFVYFMLRVFNKKVKPIYKAARDKAGEVTARLQENLSGVVVIKIFGREKQEAKRFREATEAYYTKQIQAINARTFYFPLAQSVGFLSNVGMIGVGGYLILSGGSFTLGKLLAFRAYWWRLFGPITTLARVNDTIQRAAAAGTRVFEVLDAPDELPDVAKPANLPAIVGSLELSDVSFTYPTGDGRGVLHDVSLHVEPGQIVAICGPSGAGKSTVLNLMLRFYDPAGGSVRLDDIDLKQIAREDLRKHFALVQQESFLFNDTILDNVRYGHPEATLEEVYAAARAANAHRFITDLPFGYDTKVGERGVRLSGGQKQRISIARAFLADPSVLLLDEPTSSVEPDSEATIITALLRLMKGRTTVITSHRPSLIRQADVVYVIEDGRVSDSGPPEELEQRGGWFARFMGEPDEDAAMSPSPVTLDG